MTNLSTWDRSIGRWSAFLLATSLVATVAVSAVAAAIDALGTLVLLLLAGAALVVAIWRPVVLFYAYCAAIPFNFALPPGPAGTVARIAGLSFFLGYLVLKPDSLRPKTIPVVGWVFIGWTLLSCLWAIDTQTAFSAWLSLAQLFAITVLIASLVAVSPRTVRNAVWSYAISATATAVVGSVTYLQSPVIFLTRAVAFPDQDPALFASLLLPAAIFLMWELQSRTSGIPVRLAAAFALVICVVALALSGTRSAWAGVVVAIVVWLVLQREPRQVIAVAALASGVVVLVAVVPGVGEFLLGRTASSLTTGGAGRTDIWVVGLSIFAAAPLIGAGFGNFRVAFSPYAIAQAPAEAAVQGAVSAGRASHNVLLGTLVETGLVGGILLVVFLASALRQPANDRIANLVRVVLIGLFVQSLFLDILLQKQLWLFLAISFGLGAARRAEAVSAVTRMR
jgi:exopolysaccharide production protein ExoQ